MAVGHVVTARSGRVRVVAVVECDACGQQHAHSLSLDAPSPAIRQAGCRGGGKYAVLVVDGDQAVAAAAS